MPFSLDPEVPPIKVKGKGATGSYSPGAQEEAGTTGESEQGSSKPGILQKVGSFFSRKGKGDEGARGPAPEEPSVAPDLDKNLLTVRRILHTDRNSDVIIREFLLPVGKGIRAAFVFIDGMVNLRAVNADILRPLLDPDFAARLARGLAAGNVEKLFPAAATTLHDSMRKVVTETLMGNLALFVDGLGKALVVDVKGWEKRPISEPVTERVVIGPHEAFAETLKVNITMLRRILRTPDLICELLEVGKVTHTQVAIFHIEHITNPRLVNEVKRRISSIKASYVAESAILDQLIDVPRFWMVPHAVLTERPDRFAGAVAEGYVGIMVDHSPFGLVVPITIADFFSSAEDIYLRPPAPTFLKLIRASGMLATLILPGLYIAAVTFHHEMIPSVLLQAIAASKEGVPTPTPLAVFAGELGFDFIREAGVRVPSPVGPTIGIVGALLIGDAAVRASLLAPVTVIIIAVTAVASFTIPNQDVATLVRIFKYVFIVAGSTFGILGIGLLLYVVGVYLCSLRSFGVPIVAPVIAGGPSARDVVARRAVWKMEHRPRFLRPEGIRRQPPVSRTWTLARPLRPCKRK